jgi:hypothetical protein
MSVMNKIKLGAAVIIGVPIAGAAAYAGYDTYAHGAGSVHAKAIREALGFTPDNMVER